MLEVLLIGYKMNTYQELIELKNSFKANDFTIRKLNDIMVQEDYRYTDPWSNVITASFLDNKAVILRNFEFGIPKVEENKINLIPGPQKKFKLYAVKLAENMGFKVCSFEGHVRGGIVDILATRNRQKLFIECCSCRIDKIIEYLSIRNSILWVMLRDIEDRIRIFEFGRGPNWRTFKRFYDKYMEESIQKNYEKLSKNFESN